MPRPLLTHAARPATYEVDAVNERGETVPTPIAGEHPLTLYLDKREVVTLMTLGGAPEALALGYLRNQRLMHSIDEIAAVQLGHEERDDPRRECDEVRYFDHVTGSVERSTFPVFGAHTGSCPGNSPGFSGKRSRAG